MLRLPDINAMISTIWAFLQEKDKIDVAYIAYKNGKRKLCMQKFKAENQCYYGVSHYNPEASTLMQLLCTVTRLSIRCYLVIRVSLTPIVTTREET